MKFSSTTAFKSQGSSGGGGGALNRTNIQSLKKVLVKECKQNISMSMRSEEWFLADKRLIFACEDQDIYREWVSKLKQIIPGINKGEVTMKI